LSQCVGLIEGNLLLLETEAGIELPDLLCKLIPREAKGLTKLVCLLLELLGSKSGLPVECTRKGGFLEQLTCISKSNLRFLKLGS
jgi:hypothetical protein